MYNRVVLIGRVTREIELKYSQQGTAIANFTLAVNRKFNKDEADFIDIVVWRGQAESCASYLQKGSLCCVEGRVQIRSYETNEGQKRKVFEVVADDVRFLDSKGKSESSVPKSDWKDIGREYKEDPLGLGLDAEDYGDDSDNVPF